MTTLKLYAAGSFWCLALVLVGGWMMAVLP